jgi:hypothetical protein
MANIPDGYGFVGPRGRKIAEALLDLSAKIGSDPALVRAQMDGYLAPEAVVREYEKGLGTSEEGPLPDTEPMDPVPDGSWKNADIEDYAEQHGIDLGGATKKADMLSAISAATKEE